MSSGQGGVPGLPTTNMAPTNLFDNMKQNQANINTAVNPQNIFSLIQQGYTSSPSMTSVLPQIQAQYSQQSAAAQPQYDAIQRGGEQMAGQAQSDAGARGMRGSDIEASGMAGARQDAQNNIAQLRSQMAVAQAQDMSSKIFQAYGFDIQQNSQLYNNLAQAIGQQYTNQENIRLAEEQLAMQKKQIKQNSSNSFLSSLMGMVGTIGGAAVGGPAGAAVGGSIGRMV